MDKRILFQRDRWMAGGQIAYGTNWRSLQLRNDKFSLQKRMIITVLYVGAARPGLFPRYERGGNSSQKRCDLTLIFRDLWSRSRTIYINFHDLPWPTMNFDVFPELM